jgi:hypothetical protein
MQTTREDVRKTFQFLVLKSQLFHRFASDFGLVAPTTKATECSTLLGPMRENGASGVNKVIF